MCSAELPPTSALEKSDSSVSRGEVGAECHALIRSNNSSIASTSQRWPARGSGGSSTGSSVGNVSLHVVPCLLV